MHMADALISPAVGGTMWAASAAAIAYCSKKVKEDLDERKVPLMGVLGAFVFAAQMINFTIPATGSSGHLGGGMLLAILLGPYAAFLVIASVLVVQALFFADGGLLALGCNIFNLGFFPAFIAYPLIYKKIVKGEITKGKLALGASLAAISRSPARGLRRCARDPCLGHHRAALLHLCDVHAAHPSCHRDRGGHCNDRGSLLCLAGKPPDPGRVFKDGPSGRDAHKIDPCHPARSSPHHWRTRLMVCF